MKLWQAVQLAVAKRTNQEIFIAHRKWARTAKPIRILEDGTYQWWLTPQESSSGCSTTCADCCGVCLGNGTYAYSAGITVGSPYREEEPDWSLHHRYLFLSLAEAQADIRAYLTKRARALRGRATQADSEQFRAAACLVRPWGDSVNEWGGSADER